jgi:hypothetical protein
LSFPLEGRIYLKEGAVVEEADETVFWLELLVETGIVDQVGISNLLTEMNLHFCSVTPDRQIKFVA